MKRRRAGSAVELAEAQGIDWLDSLEFEAALHGYRTTPLYDTPAVMRACDALKELIREKFRNGEARP